MRKTPREVHRKDHQSRGERRRPQGVRSKHWSARVYSLRDIWECRDNWWRVRQGELWDEGGALCVGLCILPRRALYQCRSRAHVSGKIERVRVLDSLAKTLLTVGVYVSTEQEENM